MKCNDLNRGFWPTLLLLFFGMSVNVFALDYTIYFNSNDAKLKALEFGVGDLTKALEDANHTVSIKSTNAPNDAKDCFIFNLDGSAEKETYSISASGNRYEVEGSRIGLMYGALELAENVNNNSLTSLNEGDREPHLEKRGLKLNIPLDARTPSYADFGTAAQENIGEMWSMDFWKEQLDAMARNRYNCYTLWNLHPFPSMVKLKDYPNVALDDIMRADIDLLDKNDGYNTKGIDMVDEDVLDNLVTIKKMTIDEKVKFWQDVMQYGHDRGIEFHMYTWNVFVWGAGGKDSIITNEQLDDYRDHWSGFRNKDDYDTLVDYYYQSTKAMLETYPLLAGIGITAGEGFGDASSREEEEFLSDTYGRAAFDVIESDKDRELVVVHRAHQADEDLIHSEFSYLIDEPRITFDFSTKYANARLYSYAGSDQDDKSGFQEEVEDVPEGGKWWLNLRNDDIFNLRWGDYDFVQTFITHMDPPEAIRGFHMGPDG